MVDDELKFHFTYLFNITHFFHIALFIVRYDVTTRCLYTKLFIQFEHNFYCSFDCYFKSVMNTQ